MISILFHSESELELGEAALFYESRLIGLGIIFADEVRKSVELIRHYPEVGQPLGPRLRKLVIKRFPYSLIYRWDEQHILILAVAHHRRRPGYWKLRHTPA